MFILIGNKMLEIQTFLLLILIGIAISIVVSMVGLGGGIFFIPLFIIVYSFDADIAVGTSIFCMILTTLSSTIGYYQHGFVNFKLGLAYDIFDIPGILLGAWITTILPTIILESICGIAIIILAMMVIFKKNKKPATQPKTVCNLSQDPLIEEKIISNIGQNHEYPPKESISSKNKVPINGYPRKLYDFSFAWSGKNIKWVIFSSFLGGLITGMVGLGGGTVDTTTMIILGVPTQLASGSSSFAMLLTNIFGASSHILLGNVYWDFAIPIGIGALIGAQIGSRVATKINPNILRRILGIIAMITGIRLIFA
jgi:uncharacterized membrane protein YfcA